MDNSARFRPTFQSGRYKLHPHPSSSFSNISRQGNNAMIIVSASDPVTVTGVSAGNNTVLILGQMSIATIGVLAGTCGIRFDPTKNKNGIYKLGQRDRPAYGWFQANWNGRKGQMVFYDMGLRRKGQLIGGLSLIMLCRHKLLKVPVTRELQAEDWHRIVSPLKEEIEVWNCQH